MGKESAHTAESFQEEITAYILSSAGRRAFDQTGHSFGLGRWKSDCQPKPGVKYGPGPGLIGYPFNHGWKRQLFKTGLNTAVWPPACLKQTDREQTPSCPRPLLVGFLFWIGAELLPITFIFRWFQFLPAHG